MDDVFPQVAFKIGDIAIRDTVVSTWIMMVIMVAGAIYIGRRGPVVLELIADFLADLISSVIGRPAAPYLPLLGTLAIFIAVANVIGVVPGITTPTKDINTPAALAIVVFFSVYYYGIRSKGVVKYFRDMASPLFVLPLEIIGQFTRTLSLTLRLFGNILSTELIVAIVFALMPVFVTLPLQGFSIFTGLLQAYIFTALASVYIGAGLEITEPNDLDERTS
jgi:F-type H+-transporting ATPase subunit a